MFTTQKIYNTIDTSKQMESIMKYLIGCVVLIVICFSWSALSKSISKGLEDQKIQGQCISKLINLGIERKNIIVDFETNTCKEIK
ncbi:hypothetical protein KNT81_gp260 [Proteus phage phiP4-3]|uniref:Uncharacterized protein n=1 Tax=Proteus phage phiP4-3 TaxID=2065203 RepID=A0A2I6PFM7_9CAUD|nr:hypothetical protein KNT81_gp260 [Proteus phage phiP4-3]AUM58511.1 hypothetical protein phiP43_153 [Proteus phage phiP4-3]